MALRMRGSPYARDGRGEALREVIGLNAQEALLARDALMEERQRLRRNADGTLITEPLPEARLERITRISLLSERLHQALIDAGRR